MSHVRFLTIFWCFCRSPTNIASFWRCPVALTTATSSGKLKTSKSASSTTYNRSKQLASSTSLILAVKMPHMSSTSSHHASLRTKVSRESHRIWCTRLRIFRIFWLSLRRFREIWHALKKWRENLMKILWKSLRMTRKFTKKLWRWKITKFDAK